MNSKERAQEWIEEYKFYDELSGDAMPHDIIRDLLAVLTTAERERDEFAGQALNLAHDLEDSNRERDEAIAERDRYKVALDHIASDKYSANYSDSYILSESLLIAREALKGGGI